MKNLFGYYIRTCRMKKKLSLRECGVLCNLSHTHIDSLEKGKDFRTGKKVSPTPETIEKIANGLMLREYALFNLSLEKVNDKFNCFLCYTEREELKADARNILNDDKMYENLSINDLAKYQEDIFLALFSRSVEAADFDILHVDFKTYVSMLLNQNQFKTKIKEEIYDILVKKYGTSEGIPEGQTYYSLANYNIIDSKPSNLKLFEEYCIIRKYNKLNEIGQKKVNDYIDDLSENSNYLKEQPDNEEYYPASAAAFGGAHKQVNLKKENFNALQEPFDFPLDD